MSSSNDSTQERDIPIAVTVSSMPAENNTTYAQPVYNEGQQGTSTSNFYIMMPFRAGSAFDEKMLMAGALARSMRCLALFDFILLCLLGIWNLVFFLGVWGPLCGYYGAKNFKKNFVLVYAAYWAIRTIFDFFVILNGNLWFLLSLLIDIYIFSYVWKLVQVLGSLSEEELTRLQSPFADNEVNQV